MKLQLAFDALKRGAANTRLAAIPDEGVIHGDALEILPRLATASFHAAIVDPPYRLARKTGLVSAFSSHVTLEDEWDFFSPVEYEAFTEQWLREVCRVVKPGGNIVIFGSYHGIYLVGSIIQRLGLRIINHLVWSKPNAQPNLTTRMFCESAEHAIWLVNGAVDGAHKATNWTFNYDEMKVENGGKQMRNVWDIPLTPASEKKHGKHPTQKPRKLIGRIIRALTNEGDRVLDPFCGSGTTLEQAWAHNRVPLGIEREADYVAIASARALDVPDPDVFAAAVEPDPTHVNLGRSLWARGQPLPATALPAARAEYERLVELAGPPIENFAPIAAVAAALETELADKLEAFAYEPTAATAEAPADAIVTPAEEADYIASKEP